MGRRITEKVVNGFWRNLLEGWGMAQGPRNLISVTIRITVRIQESEVRNPYSPLDYRKSYQWILMKFYGELGCVLETNWYNWLHFGVDPQIQPFFTVKIHYLQFQRPGKIAWMMSTLINSRRVLYHLLFTLVFSHRISVNLKTYDDLIFWSNQISLSQIKCRI